VKQLALDAVSSPLTRLMYARALKDFLDWWENAMVRSTPTPTQGLVLGVQRKSSGRNPLRCPPNLNGEAWKLPTKSTFALAGICFSIPTAQ
jgi:hypothetical protein